MKSTKKSTEQKNNFGKDNKLNMLFATFCIIIFMWCVIYIVQTLVIDKINTTKREILETIYEETKQIEKNAKSQAFDEFLEINSDFIGWLKIGESKFPVVQTTDNSKYLTLDFYKNFDKRGTIFTDYRINVENVNETHLLYGHNYNFSHEMFYEIEKLKDINYINKHPYIEFNTIYGNRLYIICGVFLTDADSKSNDYFDYNNLFLNSNPQEKENFVNNIKERNLFNSNIDFDKNDSIILFSTCGYDFSTERIVAVAKLTDKKTDSPPIYTKNLNAKMPRIWNKLYK